MMDFATAMLPKLCKLTPRESGAIVARRCICFTKEVRRGTFSNYIFQSDSGSSGFMIRVKAEAGVSPALSRNCNAYPIWDAESGRAPLSLLTFPSRALRKADDYD